MRLRLLAPALTFVALLLGAAAAVSLADSTTVKDQKRETQALSKNGRVDIVRASASHRGELLEHTVVVRNEIKRKRKRERPLIGINTRGSSSSDPEFLVYGKAIFKSPKAGKPIKIGSAKLSSHKRRWTYRFDPAAFPNGGLERYGWVAFTTTKKALDVVPANSYEIHRP